MPTLFIKVSDHIKVKDVVQRIVNFIARIVKQVYTFVAQFIQGVQVKIREARAPPVKKIYIKHKKKGGAS